MKYTSTKIIGMFGNRDHNHGVMALCRQGALIISSPTFLGRMLLLTFMVEAPYSVGAAG